MKTLSVWETKDNLFYWYCSVIHIYERTNTNMQWKWNTDRSCSFHTHTTLSLDSGNHLKKWKLAAFSKLYRRQASLYVAATKILLEPTIRVNLRSLSHHSLYISKNIYGTNWSQTSLHGSRTLWLFELNWISLHWMDLIKWMETVWDSNCWLASNKSAGDQYISWSELSRFILDLHAEICCSILFVYLLFWPLNSVKKKVDLLCAEEN